jgi:hypothetical protein
MTKGASILDKLDKVMRNRYEVAKRWRGLSDDDAEDYVNNDPDVVALTETPEFEAASRTEIAKEMIDHLRNSKGKEFTYWDWYYRKHYGDEIVDKVLALLEGR